MLTPADARRRWFGMLFLALAAGLLIWGQTVLKSHLTGLWFVAYWLACFAFTGLALLTALLDAWIIRAQNRREQRELLRRALDKVQNSAAREKHANKPAAEQDRR